MQHKLVRREELEAEKARRDSGAEKLLQFLKETQAEQSLSTPESRRELILQTDFGVFENWLQRVNGISRRIKPVNRDLYDTDSETYSMNAPDIQDRQLLLKQAWRASKRILEPETEVDQKLKDVSLLLGGAINFIHPFEDGNGRASRVVSLLAREGFDGSQKSRGLIKEVVGENGRWVLNNNPRTLAPLLNNQIYTSFWKQAGLPDGPPTEIELDDMVMKTIEKSTIAHLSESTQRKAWDLKHAKFGSLARLCTVLLMRGIQLSPRVWNRDQGVWLFSEQDYFDYCGAFSDKYIELAHSLQRDLLCQFVSLFIDSIENPNNYPVQPDELSYTDLKLAEPTTIRDYYLRKVNHYSDMYDYSP